MTDLERALTDLETTAAEAWDNRPSGTGRNRPRYADQTEPHTRTGEALARAAEAVEVALGALVAPHTPQTTWEAALVAYATLIRWMTADGHSPRSVGWETFLLNPEQSANHYAGPHWHLCYESGPSGWGDFGRSKVVPAELRDGPWGYCETYWGFDLIFVED